ncbi:hypothetical protein LTR36_009724 [Oleoguttula mirabilis]|uniref:Uncharacterized protein n=1 Tax=Oleoguttula mirabilis TaxID=1507867 RepID=A0AAV9J577_9PEZI|nr:hypothetical protein LTR36_009724 [Oleoguttula mirabilis]
MGLTLYSDNSFSAPPQRTARAHFMMYTPRAQAAYQHQQFFFEQKEKLSSLLNTVGRDAKAATNYQLGADYYELTAVVTQLLEEAQLMSGFTFNQIQQSGVQMQPFAEKVQLVETVAVEVRMRAITAAKPVSRKRGRTTDGDEEEMSYAVKRYRQVPVDQEMVIQPAFCAPYANKFMQSAWWTQPMCD